MSYIILKWNSVLSINKVTNFYNSVVIELNVFILIYELMLVLSHTHIRLHIRMNRSCNIKFYLNTKNTYTKHKWKKFSLYLIDHETVSFPAFIQMYSSRH